MNLVRHRLHLERRLDAANELIATLLDERDLARNERDTARAELDAARDEVLRLEANGIANDPSLWRAIANRAADEAEGYARQLRANKIDPNRDYGRPDTETAPSW